MEALALGDSLLEYTPFQGCVDGFDFQVCLYVLGDRVGLTGHRQLQTTFHLHNFGGIFCRKR